MAEPPQPKAGFGTLLKVFSFGTAVDRTFQIIGAIAAIGAGAALPFMTLVFGKLVNVFTQFESPNATVSPEEFRRQINSNTIWFIYLFAGKFVLVYIHTTCFTLTADRMIKALRLKYLRSLLHQEVSYFEDADSRSIAGSITTNSDSIQAGVADKFGSAIQALAMFVAAFAVAFSQQWKLTLATASIIPGIMVAMGITVGLDTKIEAKILETYAICGALAEEVLGSIRTVVAFGATEKVANQYNAMLRGAEVNGRKKGPLMGIMFSSQFFFMFCGYALSFWLGLRLYKSGDIHNPGTIITVFFSVLIALSALMQVGPNMPAFGKAVAAAGAVFDIMEREQELDQKQTQGDIIPLCGGHIEFRNVSFSYPSRPSVKVLSNATLEFPDKNVTAIVGPSGSGKSTIVGLLERWFNPTEGTILLDGHDTKNLDLKWLRSQIAFVQQEPQLFNTTIFENVADGLIGSEAEHVPHEIKLELVKEACVRASAYEFINNLPNGFDTVVGDHAGLLSGGQKQRIAIARAIIGNRPILLLDEATSALDPKSEAAIDSLSFSSFNRTTIIISHKLSTVKKADRIIVVDKGEIVEQGTHKDLVEAGGVYSRLLNAQNLFLDEDDHSEPLKLVNTAEEIKEHEDTLASTPSGQETLLVANPRRRGLLNLLSKIAWEHKRYWLIFTVGVIACIAGGGVFPAQAILFARIIGVFQKPLPQMIHDGNFWALMFLVLALSALLSYALLGFFMTLLGTLMTRFYRYEYFRSMARQDIVFFDQNASGTLAARLSRDPTDLHELISVKLGLIITVFVNLIGSAAVALIVGWKLALVALFGALPVVFTAGYIRLLLDSQLSEGNAKLFEESTRFASEAVSAIRTVKSFTLESKVYGSYEQRLAEPMAKAFKQTFVIMIFFALSESLEFLAMALGFWYGGRLLSTREYNSDQFFTVFVAIIMGGQAAGFMFGFSSNFNKARMAANNILNLREQKPPINGSTGLAIDSGEKESDVVVDFRDVSFAYPTRPQQPVLRGLSLQVKRGQTVGLVGASGCGKTTVISLLERFYDIQSGQLLVYGKPLSSLDVNEYRKTVSLVSQEPTLYRGSVRDNIMFGVTGEVGEERFLQACKDANIHTFVTSLPEGYETECGPSGVALSGGQRQRVAIARALIRDPDVLLLDEASSALDTESEQLVQEALERAGRGRATVVVAHRLSTIRNADVICVFSNGRVVERGTHSQLVALRGRYFRMCQAQALSD